MKKFFALLIAALLLGSCSMNHSPTLSTTSTTLADEEPLPDLKEKSSYTPVDIKSVSKLKKGELIEVSGTVFNSNQNELWHKLIVFDGTGLWRVNVNAVSDKNSIPEDESFNFYGFFYGEDDELPLILVNMYEPTD